jgi:adenylate cyclase
MAAETERKFLVSGEGWRADVTASIQIVQAYLALRDDLEVRVRIIDGERASLTIKAGGARRSRAEFEYPIPVADAEQLVALGQGRTIRKRRHIVPRGRGRHWEVDLFEGDHAGLCLAEVELGEGEERSELQRPDWLGREVTGDPAYYNAALSRAG